VSTNITRIVEILRFVLKVIEPALSQAWHALFAHQVVRGEAQPLAMTSVAPLLSSL
jgi:hypothetical protein